MSEDPRGLDPLAPTGTGGVAPQLADLALDPGTADRGTADRGVARQGTALPDPAAASRGRRIEDGFDIELAEHYRRLLRASKGLLPGPIEFGVDVWLWLLRYLLRSGYQRDAQDLFERAGEAATAWARSIVDRYWKVGVGFAVDGAIGATFGVPFQLTGEAKFNFYRSTATKFTFKREGIVDGGLDSGIGAGGYIQLGTAGAGRRIDRATARQGIGANAAAQAQLSLVLRAEEEFEFPVFEDPGLLPLLVFIASVDDEVRLASVFETSLKTLLPDPYRKKLKLEGKLSARGGALAEAGVRTRGERTGERTVDPETGRKYRPRRRTFKAKRTVGKTEDSSREFVFFDDKQKGWRYIFNLRGLIQQILRASLSGTLNLEAGGGLVIEPKYGRDKDGVPEFEKAKVQFFAEGRSAVSLAAVLPLIGGLLPGLNLDATAGLRVNLEAKAPISRKNTSLVDHEVYLQTGDLDADDRPAHETAMQLPGLDLETYASLETFVAAIETTKMVYRIGIGSTIGRDYTIALSRFKTFTTMLSPGYDQRGIHVVGLVTFKFLLPGEIVRQMVAKIGDLLLAEIKADPAVKVLIAKATEAMKNFEKLPELPGAAQDAAKSLLSQAVEMLRTFWQTGKMPPKTEAITLELLETMIGGLQEIKFHGELGYGIAAELQAAKGAKARLHGALNGRITYDRDILALLKQEMPQVLVAKDLLAMLRGAFDDAALVLNVLPEMLERARRAVR